MTSNYSLRPEDFRFAWANAYHRSLMHVAELQQGADLQLKAAKDLLELSSEQTEFSRKNLYQTATVIIQQLQKAGDASEARIDAATQRLTESARGLFEKELQLRKETEQLANQLRQDRAQFQRERSRILNKPLWRRIFHAFKKQG